MSLTVPITMPATTKITMAIWNQIQVGDMRRV
ncbi:MAG: hypothetical protein JWM73_511 [Solirubrobacterales bacterium]|jgi:hypothetical protein|nr:hypothetical protein [Solirubrobacterales bacterium]